MDNFDRFLEMRFNRLANPEGSAVVGFTLVAPLTVAVFLAVAQIVYLLAVRTAVSSAAHSGSRTAAVLGSTVGQGRIAVNNVLVAHGVDDNTARVTWRRTSNRGIPFLEVTVNCTAHVLWLRRDIGVTATARAVDENRL